MGFDRSYPTLVREIRQLGLRPVCECCKAGAVKLTVGLEHEPGEELQLDWLELTETPWGVKAYVLVGALSHSGRLRGGFAEGESFPARGRGAGWRAAPVGRHREVVADRPDDDVRGPGHRPAAGGGGCAGQALRVQVVVCPARRAQRKGVVEAAIHYVPRSWWRRRRCRRRRRRRLDLDRWCVAVSDHRRRGRSRSRARRRRAAAGVAAVAYPAEHRDGGSCRRRAGRVRGQSLQRRRRATPGHGRRARAARRAAPGVYTPAATGSRRIAARWPAPARRPHRRARSALEQAVLAAFTTKAVSAQAEPAAGRGGADRGRPPARRAARRGGRRSGELRADREGGRTMTDYLHHYNARDRPRAGRPGCPTAHGPKT